LPGWAVHAIAPANSTDASDRHAHLSTLFIRLWPIIGQIAPSETEGYLPGLSRVT
jgi:hypothetical protein